MARHVPSDAEVIGASLANPRAFEAIFDRHFRHVGRYVRRRLSPPVADDLAAEVFMTAFAARRSYDLSQPNALPWLYGITANLIRRRARQEQQELRAIARSEPQAVAVADEPLDELLRHIVEPRLARALLELKPDDREVLLLFAWANLGYDEIARALDLPVGTVKSRLNRARRVFRELLTGVPESEVVNG